MLGLFARPGPVAVVTRDVDGAHAFDMNAEPVEIDTLLDVTGDLSELLAR